MYVPDFGYDPIKDSLRCASKGLTYNNDRIAYGRGVLVGMVAGMMSGGMNTFEEVVEKIRRIGETHDITLNEKCIPAGKEWEPLYDLVEAEWVDER